MFPLPRVDDILENLRDSSVFTTLDMKTASIKSNLMKGAEISLHLGRCQDLIDLNEVLKVYQLLLQLTSVHAI